MAAADITPTLTVSGGIAPGKHRIHPAYVVMNALGAIVALVIFAIYGGASQLAALAFDPDRPLWLLPLILVAFVVLLGVIVGFSVFYYRRFTWEITETGIGINSGVVFRKQVHIPFQRVQSVDFNAKILERILGICTLKIETAGGAANKAVRIPALKLNEAEALRAEVFNLKRIFDGEQQLRVEAEIRARRNAQLGIDSGGEEADPAPVQPRFDPQTGQPLAAAGRRGQESTATQLVGGIGELSAGVRGIFAEQYEEDAPVEYEYGLKASELSLAALSNDSVLLGAALSLGGFLTFISPILNLIFAEGYPDGWRVIQVLPVPLLVFLGIMIAVLIFVFGAVGMAVSYGGFKARRRGGRIEVEHGLLQRSYRGVGIPRVQTVVVSQGFFRRIFGYAELTLQTIDTADAAQNQNNAKNMATRGLMLHPFIKLNRVEALLAGLLPEFNGRPQSSDYQKLPPVALRRVISRRAVLAMIVPLLVLVALGLVVFQVDIGDTLVEGLLTTVFGVCLALFVIALAVALVGAVLWYRNGRYAWNQDFLVTRQGGWGIKTLFIPRQKIQWGEYKQTPFQRMSKVATIMAATAAGLGGTQNFLKDVPRDTADAYRDWLKPRNIPSGEQIEAAMNAVPTRLADMG
ncbi:MAG: PH domain-containing protein [Actinomycetia bacterium]|nr:PH domain-containing protein [Actinomycetes bacterium]